MKMLRRRPVCISRAYFIYAKWRGGNIDFMKAALK